MPNLLKILVVEDEPEKQDYYIDTLKTAAFKPYVDTVYLQSEGNYQAAIDLILGASPPDLLLLDHTLSGGNGLALLKEIKKQQDTVPYHILLTADPALGHLYGRLGDRQLGYLHKDSIIDFEIELLDRVKTAYELRFPHITINRNRYFLKDLLYIKGNRDKSTLYYTDRQEPVSARLGDIANANPVLKRCHNSFLVNPLRITAVTAEYIFFRQRRISLGPTYKANF